MIAHLSYLVYLDFRLIDAPSRDAALEQYRYAIEEIVHNETLAQKILEEKGEEESRRKLHKVRIESMNCLLSSSFVWRGGGGC